MQYQLALFGFHRQALAIWSFPQSICDRTGGHLICIASFILCCTRLMMFAVLLDLVMYKYNEVRV